MPNPKILIAEDEVDTLEIISKNIAQAGYEVVKAKDGQEALEKIYSESPDVIILDILMPKMDGFEVLKKLRAKPLPEKWQPVIIVSAQGDLEHIRTGYNLDADYYITKPFDMSTVLKSIRIMLNLVPQRKPKEEIDKSKGEF